MKILAAIILGMCILGGIASAQAHPVDDCQTLSDSVYGIWGCR
jgi:hypothetical protein